MNEVFIRRETPPKRWDGQSKGDYSQPETVTVEATTHRAAYREAFFKLHGVAPPEDKVNILPENQIVAHGVNFWLDEDDYPMPGRRGEPWLPLEDE
ncbi:MAG: hypothetical protein ACYC6A_00890 [Armatimonadota bacterium]